MPSFGGIFYVALSLKTDIPSRNTCNGLGESQIVRDLVLLRLVQLVVFETLSCLTSSADLCNLREPVRMSASAETSSLAGKPGFVAAVSEAECISKLFGGRAVIADTVGVVAKTKSASKVQAVEDGGIETAYGGFLATIQKRTRVADKVTSILSAGKKLAPQTVSTLHGWLESRHDAAACATALEFADQWLARDGAFDADVKQLYDNRDILEKRSMWIVVADGFGEGSDVAGLHHVLAGGEDINVLVLASDPAHGAGADQAAARARRDLGLYALNYGASYVASTAPTVNPAQFESALKEADAFKGPSVVLAYVPVRADHEAEDAAAAVAAGEWPLYRWDPAVDAAGGNGFTIDSEKLKEGLKEFLDRNTHLSMLTRAEPQLPASLTSSLESEAGARVAAGEAGLKASFDRLMGALTLPPLVVLYGSDGGNAEAVAKRLAVEARGKGFKDVSVKIMDSYPLEQLHAAPVALFVVSTAGQGEFPSNARTFWKGLSTSAPGAVDYSSTHFAVFGLGDSNYWPRKEQRIFFNKSSADLQEKLEQLGAKPLVERGVGDDQSPGGFNADFKRWLPELWTSLGVGSPADANADVPRVRGNEDIKKTSNFLRGTILQVRPGDNVEERGSRREQHHRHPQLCRHSDSTRSCTCTSMLIYVHPSHAPIPHFCRASPTPPPAPSPTKTRSSPSSTAYTSRTTATCAARGSAADSSRLTASW